MTDLIKRDDALLPCPFCGGDENIIIHTEYDGWDACAVSCGYKECHGAVFTLAYGHFTTQAEAITAWNTRALAAVTVGVKPLVWHDRGFTYHAFDPIDGQTIHAETKEDIDRIEAERQQRILSALEPQPLDPAAIREVALREAALKIQSHITELKHE